ncbi:MAG: NAD(P)/FAD-dependent oxidoreductase [Thermodesulfobacteriota bacterium]
MPEELTIKVDPEFIDDREHLNTLIRQALPASIRGVDGFRIVKRSIDARSRNPAYILKIALASPDESDSGRDMHVSRFRPVSANKTVLIVGAGPAGYFAALKLIEHGLKPVILERGADVVARRKAIAGIHRHGIVSPDSNYCFGEGGAGAYSDGKLYTRSTKRGDTADVIRLLVAHGAREDLLVDAHPHIGSNRLPRIIREIRNTILSCGGEIHFQTRVDDFIPGDGRIRGVRVDGGGEYQGEAVILACGHSARDLFAVFPKNKWLIEPKPFAAGLRVEHPQALIDQIRYHQRPRHPNLPPASYRIAAQIEDRGVYSFCMCPGGVIIPAATAPGEMVINGMSFSDRGGPHANAGIVVEIRLEDLLPGGFTGPFMALDFQKKLEQAAFQAGGGDQNAPAQRLTDFVEGRFSDTLPVSSYRPGIRSAPLHNLLPPDMSRRLRQAFIVFGKKMKGYYTREAIVVGVESRTSSPVRIPRDVHSLAHPQVANLYPCGEGAGHAGGIVSAAMDGQQAARRIAAVLA